MLRQEKPKINIENLNSLVEQILDSIKDNNQNIKDCNKLLREIKKLIKPDRPSFLQKLKKLFL